MKGMVKDMKIGVIGVGNMGYPILQAIEKTFGADKVCFTDISEKARQKVTEELKVEAFEQSSSLSKACDYVVLAVKPQFFDQVLADIKGNLKKDAIIISIAAGITIWKIKSTLGDDTRVVRSMPNTAAMLGEAMTGVCFSNDIFTEEERKIITLFFSSFGKFEIVDEKLMNAVVCANGSSPAYVYMFIEALADSVVKYGIPRNQAYRLVAQTVLGAAKMVMETKEHPGRLKDNVCSPAGTTIAGVAALEEFGFRNAIIKATDACYERALELQKNTEK